MSLRRLVQYQVQLMRRNVGPSLIKIKYVFEGSIFNQQSGMHCVLKAMFGSLVLDLVFFGIPSNNTLQLLVHDAAYTRMHQ